MSFYRNRVYPHIVTVLGNPEPIQKIRQQIIPLARGTVLEVGVGPGVNFPYYDPTRVSKIYALERSTKERNTSSICDGVSRVRRSIHQIRTAKKAEVR